jgi:hypothetical protein
MPEDDLRDLDIDARVEQNADEAASERFPSLESLSEHRANLSLREVVEVQRESLRSREYPLVGSVL